MNDITINKRLGNLMVRSFEMPYVSYCQPLAFMLAHDSEIKIG